MKKQIIPTLLLLLISFSSIAQKLHYLDEGRNIDKKAMTALRFDYEIVDKESADYAIELFFKKVSEPRPYRSYYRIFDRTGNEVYKSQEWRASGYGFKAENYFIKKAIEKDLPKALKLIIN